MQTVQEFHQVTIVFMGSEVAYGEGETREYAWEEAQENIPEEYKDCATDVMEVIHLNGDSKEVVTYWDALTVWC